MAEMEEPVAVDAEGAAGEPTSAPRSALQRRIKRTIQADKKHFEKPFKRMKRDMRVAMHGHDEDWSEHSYKANITGRHVKAKTAALYAKNPKAVARRAQKIDFQVWDENQDSLMLAFQTVQQATMIAQSAAGGPVLDQATGAMMPAPEPALPPGFEQAQAVIADFQAGMAQRQEAAKIGKTLEVLFTHALAEQQPLDFKRSMKQVVRRACTTGVGYVKLAFQRSTGPAPSVEYRLTDTRERLERLQQLMQESGEADFDDHGESAELEAMIADLEAQPEIVISEGLVFDFPQATHVIPDKLARSLVGFVGARHLTVEYLYTVDEVQALFGVDLARQKFKEYTPDGKSETDGEGQRNLFPADAGGNVGRGLACVWEHFDKASGLVYYLCDGYDGFLREPAAPDVYVDQFWPVFALTFNEVESEDELFPPSDVSLILDIQKEYNRSRDGKREHRRAARPRWIYPHGAFEDADLDWLGSAAAFTATGMKIDPNRDIKTVLQPVPVPGVDPNLYDVNEIMADMQFVVGTSQALVGGSSRSTATGDQIAAGASATADGSSVDDLDGFLTGMTRAAGQILMREMSAETVTRIAGPGAVWPEQTLQQIADEMMLEIEAGSTGKPNQQVEIANLEKILPLLLQIPGINATWLGKEALRRFDDRLDLTDAFVDGAAAIVAQNRMAQPTPGDPNAQPEAQGHQGSDAGPRPPGGPPGRGAPTGAQSRPAAI